MWNRREKDDGSRNTLPLGRSRKHHITRDLLGWGASGKYLDFCPHISVADCFKCSFADSEVFHVPFNLTDFCVAFLFWRFQQTFWHWMTCSWWSSFAWKNCFKMWVLPMWKVEVHYWFSVLLESRLDIFYTRKASGSMGSQFYCGVLVSGQTSGLSWHFLFIVI